MMNPERIPVIVGAAQYRQAKDAEAPLDPLGLMERAGRKALADTGNAGIGALIDELHVIQLFQWSYRDAPGMLAQRLALNCRKNYYTAVGGNTPQMLVAKAARSLASGESRAVLMTGAEAFYALRRALKGEVVLQWPEAEPPEHIEGDNRSGLNDLEGRYDLFLPSYMYPLFETAFRARQGYTPEEHQRYMGQLCTRLSEIAASNPYAWYAKAYSASDIAFTSAENRYIGYPYTKRMNANIDVDQSAALIMTTVETARKLQIDPARWVYPLAGYGLNDVWYVSRRPQLHRSPAIGICARRCLEQADLSLDDIGLFDLYSCFPVVVEIARVEIGIPEEDSRDLSVTGGLSYFGGPGNNYTMHAIASAVERIRAQRRLKAMITANGWYLTKQAVGIYGGEPPTRPWWNDLDNSAQQRAVDETALPEPVEKALGMLTVEAYVIRHDKANRPDRGTVVGRLENGRRTLAHIDAPAEDLLRMEQVELVGRNGTVRFDADSGLNFVSFEGKS